MLKPSPNDIFSDNRRYSFVIAVAKRAREIVDEAEAAGTVLTEKPVSIAVDEFSHGEYVIKEKKDSQDETLQ